MSFATWVLLIGSLFLVMGLTGALVSRLPFTPTMVYLGIGVLLGPFGLGVAALDPGTYTTLFHRGAEIAVVVSLFTVGLKLRLPWGDRRWRPTLVLAFLSMTITVGLVALLARGLLDLPWGAAVLLGAILAPTDPVLASEVQLQHPGDRDRLRRALSGEAGLNDGTAFPFVMLGLGLLGLHDLGSGWWHWWTVDVGWAIIGGLGLGGALGFGTGHLILALHRWHRTGSMFDEYLLLGLIGVAYGSAVLLHAYGFLAVFSAGVAVRAVERRHIGDEFEAVEQALARGATRDEILSDPRLGPAYLANAMLSLNEQLERILEVGMVLLVGIGLFSAGIPLVAVWFLPVLFLLVRPLAVLPVWWAGKFTRRQFFGIAWFGIRGIGSIYYLMYAVEKGVPSELSEILTSLTFMIVAASILVHGASATPLRRWLERPSGAVQA